MNYYLTVLKKYAQFSGRARRSEYWYFVLFNIIAVFLLAFIGAAIGFPRLFVFYYVGILIPYIAVGVRRMHDVGKSGWFLIIPIYNLILACTAGTFGPNEYGPDPKSQVEFGADDYEKPFDING